MATTIGDYTYLFVDGGETFANPTLVAKPRKIYPIESDSTIYVLEEDYMQFIDFYEPLAPATAHTTKGNLYYVRDTPIQDVGGGVGKFTRTWAVMPGMDEFGKKKSYVNYAYESYAFRCPGISQAQAIYLINYISGYSINGDNMSFTTTAPLDIVAGKGAFIGYWVTDPLNNWRYWRGATRIALSGTGGSTLVTKKINDISAIEPSYCTRAFSNSEPYSKVVASRLDTDFWLVGTNVDSIDNIPIVQQFEIIDNATGNRTEYLSDTTTPTIDEYQQWIEDGRWIVAESSVLRRWQGSEILARTTRYVKAVI